MKIHYKEDVENFNKLYKTPIRYCNNLSEFEDFLDSISKPEDGSATTRDTETTEKEFVIVKINEDDAHAVPFYIETTFSKDGIMSSQNILCLDSTPIYEYETPFTIKDPDNKRTILFSKILRQIATIGCFEDSLLLLRDFKYLQDNCPEYDLNFAKFLKETEIKTSSDGMAKYGLTSAFPGFFMRHTEFWATLRAKRPTKERSSSPVPFYKEDSENGNSVDLAPASKLFTSECIDGLIIGKDRINSIGEAVPKISDLTLKNVPDTTLKKADMKYVDFEKQRKALKSKLSKVEAKR